MIRLGDCLEVLPSIETAYAGDTDESYGSQGVLKYPKYSRRVSLEVTEKLPHVRAYPTAKGD